MGLGGFCGLCCVPAHCAWILNFLSRGEVREKYGIRGNGRKFKTIHVQSIDADKSQGCTDCLCSGFCLPCDLIQQEKELASRSQSVVSTQPGTVPQMAYPPEAIATPPAAPQAAYYPYPQQAAAVQPAYPPPQEVLKQ